MPQQDTPHRKPVPPPSRPQQRPQPFVRLTPEEQLAKELTFSTSLQRLRESVEHGWKVTFHQFGSDDVTGYLAGFDREYFLVFVPNPAYTKRTEDPYDGYDVFGVSRGMNTSFELHRKNTFEDELAHPKMPSTVESFKEWMVRSMSKGPAGPVKQGPPRTGKPYGGDLNRNWTPPPGQPAGGPTHPHFKGA